MTVYSEDEFLQLSGLQHFLFCRRQWALIHIEQQWAENLRTVSGELMHERTHDEKLTEKRGNIIITHGMRVFSRALGVSGQCDVLEFHRDDRGVAINGWDGKWIPFPVEYKRGEPKSGSFDEAQLCCQAMCLEEMLCCHIESGALFYGARYADVSRSNIRKICGFRSKTGQTRCTSCTAADIRRKSNRQKPVMPARSKSFVFPCCSRP